MTNHPNDFASYSPRPRTTTVPAVKNPPAILKPKPSPSTSLRPVGLRQCPNCSFHVHSHYTTCPQCGEQLQAKLKKIRCRHCNKYAPSTLVICPSCGRELKAAPSRWLTWGAPVLLVALFIAILVARWDNGNPVVWAQEVMQKGVNFFLDLGERMDPNLDISTTPVAPGDSSQGVDETSIVDTQSSQVSGQEGEGDVGSTELFLASVSSDTNDAGGESSGTEHSEGGAENSRSDDIELNPVEDATEEPTPRPTDRAKPTPTVKATKALDKGDKDSQVTLLSESTVQPSMAEKNDDSGREEAVVEGTSEQEKVTSAFSDADSTDVDEISAASLDEEPEEIERGPEALQPTARPTHTPEPTATVRAESIIYEVQAGDTVAKLAKRFGISAKVIMAANDLSETDTYKLQLGQELFIPSDENFVAPSNSSSDEDASYTVRRGDTIIGIAHRFDIPTANLLAANGLSSDEGKLIQPGQILTIPDVDQAILEESAQSSATLSPAPSAATASSMSPANNYRLDQPKLKGPDNGTPLRCSADDSLAWYPISYIAPDDRYMLHLGYLDGYNEDGTEIIIWVIEYKSSPPNGTSWTLDGNLCGISSQQYGRQWRWYVEAVEWKNGQSVPISPPSEIWGFSWQ